MKRTLLFLSISLLSLSASAQENSIISIGAGYPIFPGTNKHNSYSDYSANRGNYNLFAEKSFQLFKKSKGIHLIPGVAYSQIKETFNSEGLGGGGEGEYKHKALSGYLKLIYNIDREPEIVTDYYFGLQLGYYLQSRTTGSESSWQLNSNAVYDHYYTLVDNSGSDFFHSNYFGFIAGIKPWGDKQPVLDPKIELALYPAFATLNSYFINDEKTKSMFQISVSTGFAKSRKKE